MIVRYAVGLPNVGEFGDPRILVELGVAAEEHGWHAVYVWDHLLYHDLHHDADWPVANPTVVISALAARTSRIRIGVLMTALPRRRVQTVARETSSLDVLSGGRLLFGAALGSVDAEYSAFGEDADLRVRAARLDESLETLTALWSGERVARRGVHVVADGVRMLPTPVQRPRIPIWCAGRWPNRAGFRRAARWDGAMPTFKYPKTVPVPAADFAEVVDFLRAERGGLDGFDIAVEGTTTATNAAGVIEPYAAAGLTWWVEAFGWWRGGVADARTRIAAGPPR
jgi:alkanesulfonate monooxygenase SsuD/methylene tetrahydromethanopterin reductase-like flavin-dependent oxidoreductase (luciferase family)